MIWITRSIDSGRIRINIRRQCNWHTWLHSSGGDGIRDPDIYFSSPHRTFPFTRIIFLLAKHISQLPTLSMRVWEKTSTIFCRKWFENANRIELDILTLEQMSQPFICRGHFSLPKIARGQMSQCWKSCWKLFLKILNLSNCFGHICTSWCSCNKFRNKLQTWNHFLKILSKFSQNNHLIRWSFYFATQLHSFGEIIS